MKSIDNIHEITKAMEMIAAFRFKKAENLFSHSKFYFLEIERLASNLSNAGNILTHPLFEERKVKKKLLVLVTADKGLCGSYNTNLFRAASVWFKENSGFKTGLVAVGKMGFDHFRKKSVEIFSSYPEKTKADLQALSRTIHQELNGYYLSGRADTIEILYNNFRMGSMGQSKAKLFLNLRHLLKTAGTERMEADYIYEPNYDEIFSSLLSRFLEGEIYGTLIESLASEYNARMIAMKQATDNSEEILDDLRLLRNKTRQATITRELSEIVSGASVLV